MKKFALKLGLFCALLFILVFTPAILIPQNPHIYEAGFLDKQERLKKTPSPKLVFIGGSNLVYGLDSEKIQKAIRIPVLNDGLAAAAGMYFMMDASADKLKKGDIAVFAFEYSHFSGAASGGATTTMLALFPEKTFIFELSPRTLLNVACNVPAISKSCLKDAKSLLLSGTWRVPSKPYLRECFNEFGDLVGHLDMENKKNRPSFCSAKLDRAALDFFVAKVKSLKARGVKVLVFPPVFQKTSFENWKPFVAELSEELEKRGVPFDALPERYALPDDLFFDTVYHTNAKGRALRTSLFLEDLRSVSALDAGTAF